MKKLIILFAATLFSSVSWGQIYYPPQVEAVPSIPSNCKTLPLQVVTNTNQLYGTNGSGGCSAIGSGGGGSLPSVQVEHIFASAGSLNFNHGLNDEYPLYSCFSLSGATAYTATPVDANNMQISVSAAATILCAFQATSGIKFYFTSTPSVTTYNPTMGGTQTPTFAIAQTAGSGYTGTVTYSASGLASGMTAAYSPTTITGTGSSTLSVSFPATQTPGLTTFSASGTDGTNTYATPVALTVSGINTSLVDGWPMNDGSGTSFLAGPATSNTQTFSAGIGTWATHAGFPGTSFAFNGTGSGSLGTNQTNTNFTGTTAFSVCAWVNPTTVITQSLVDTTQGANSTGWALRISSSVTGGFLVFIRNSSSNQIEVTGNSTPVTAAALNFMCMTYTGSQLASGVVLYVNAVALTPTVNANTLTSSIANTQPVVLGNNAAGALPFTGTMGYVRIYNAALTPTQISTLYAAGPR